MTRSDKGLLPLVEDYPSGNSSFAKRTLAGTMSGCSTQKGWNRFGSRSVGRAGGIISSEGLHGWVEAGYILLNFPWQLH